jgi:3D-(3,5/4)-trihydroxycyclohexane-1,2-dione acylhydrolase (decyclizing)
VNRLPVLLLPGDVFVCAHRIPCCNRSRIYDGGISANDCFRPVSRYFDRIVAPSQLLTALPRRFPCWPTAVRAGDAGAAAGRRPKRSTIRRRSLPRVPSMCGRDRRATRSRRRSRAAPNGETAGHHCRRGVLYSDGGTEALCRFAEAHGVPVTETQAGKVHCRGTTRCRRARSASPAPRRRTCWRDEADVVIAVGTRLTDFTTGSQSLFPQARLVGINVNAFDAVKARATPVLADAAAALDA